MQKSAPFDPIWHHLAPFGPFGHVWPSKALYDLVLQRLTLFGTIWHHFAPFGPAWTHLVLLGHSSILITRYLRYQFVKVAKTEQ